jgi:hypothetical protein
MLFSESRYDFQRCLWSDIWDLIKAVANPKGLGANHPKYRTTVCFGGCSSAYLLLSTAIYQIDAKSRFAGSEKNMTVL